MGLTHTESQIRWSSASTKSVVKSTPETSDAILIDPTTIAGSLAISATNSGTPTDGDTVDFYALYGNGDTSGAATTDMFATGILGIPIGTIDLGVISPRQIEVPLPIVAAKNLKIYAVNNSATNDITVAVRMMEKQSS